MHVRVSHMFLLSSELEEAIGSLGAEVKDSCGPPCGVRMLLPLSCPPDFYRSLSLALRSSFSHVKLLWVSTDVQSAIVIIL